MTLSLARIRELRASGTAPAGMTPDEIDSALAAAEVLARIGEQSAAAIDNFGTGWRVSICDGELSWESDATTLQAALTQALDQVEAKQT